MCLSSDGGVRHAVLARVLINDSLFVLCAVSLAVCIFKIAKMSSANVYLESKVEKQTQPGSYRSFKTYKVSKRYNGHLSAHVCYNQESVKCERDCSCTIKCLCFQGTSVCQATVIGAVVILLYTSRACYNLVAVVLSPEGRLSPFNYGWYNVSDQVICQCRDVKEKLSFSQDKAS